ncbi:SDR family NAD(P)-dependent oxidoreductase [Amycolatopsis sp. PS_44_ISF1]|nr:SDR family NAD(P)-dependent oxidoreductase [Amycolatopsis sp. PS_44_ISF1]MDT8913064.1 SDR family NAD(P)-dependent oxidoreductase [Amycolatopsis sp. PS_44_ISF1]
MDDKSVEYFKRMTVELRRARERVARLEAERGEAVAIVGIGLRLPGGIVEPGQFWDLLAHGRTAVGEFPADRGWDTEALFSTDPEAAGRSVTRCGSFLADAGAFDAEFFGISPREALAMDPQQRLVLETAWEALERAGIDPTSVRGSDLGVFIGASMQSYGIGAAGESEGFLLTGTAPAALSGRVSYVLGAHGPSMTVDTACSSSLVSLHLAQRALRAGECSTALAGGVTVMATPGVFTEISKQGGLAPDGVCKSFSADADGTGWSEGAGVLVLQRLSDAQREDRPVLAVLRGSAVNSDGASNGLTAPHGPAQQQVIRRALADAGLQPSDVDAVEAHGTGTVLGDPIEAQAVLATYGQDRDRPLWLGSAKSNLGHAQAAAGVAGVIKMVLAMEHELLPRTLHVRRPSEQVDWSRGAVELLTEPVAWKPDGHPRRAAVSSFGVAGTNAHLILEEAPAATGPRPAEAAGAWPLVVSARSAPALAAQAAKLAGYLGETGAGRAGVARALATARARWAHRAVVLGADPIAGLRDLAAARSSAEVVTGVAAEAPRTVFVFPGQGAQWVGMGRELWASEPVFADRMQECERALAPWVDWSLREVVLGAGALDRVEVLQPVTFAVMVSLAALLESCGVRPDAVVGHSQGEIAAACVSGALSLVDAAKVVALRAAAGAELGQGGGLLSVALPAERVVAADGIEIAAVNGPDSVVLAGSHEAIAEAERHYRERGVRVRTVAASFASHTRHAEPIAARVEELLADVRGRVPAVPWMSTVDADWVREPIGPRYWSRNLVHRVRFADAIGALTGFGLFVEVSTHPVLTSSIAGTRPDAAVAGVLRRDDGGSDRLVRALAELFAHGAEVDWTAVLPEVRPAPVPTTAFEHRHFWLRPQARGVPARLGLEEVRHPVLGAAVPSPSGGLVLSGLLSRETHPWLAEHAVSGTVLAPGSVFVELAVQAGRRVAHPVVAELVMEAPLVPGTGAVAVQVAVRGRAFEIHSRSGPEGTPWTRHATGTLAPAGARPAPLGPWPPAGAQPCGLDGFYPKLADRGYEYGPAFQGLRAAWRAGADWYGEVALEAGAGFAIHPALLDAALHPAFLGDGEPGIAFAWKDVAVHGDAGPVVRVRLTVSAEGVAVLVADESGAPVLTAGSLVTRPVSFAPKPYGVDWVPFGPVTGRLELPSAGEAAGEPWAVLRAGELGEVLEALQRFATGPTRLVVLTRDVATDPDAAAVWGLVRSAQAELPERFLLLDLPGDEIPDVLGTGEWQLAVREGALAVPRLTPRSAGLEVAEPLDPAGTVLITGGTGVLGGLVAKHLVAAHGIRRLVLASRTGANPALTAELEAAGASVRTVACDVTDREALRGLVASAGPLTGVVHAAGVFDDALIGDLTPDRLKAVLRPKAEAAAHLDELTRGLDLRAFVLFSSAAGVLSSPGQGGYAAANAYLDALAVRRRAAGFPATSLAWGLWSYEGADEQRTAREAQWTARSGLRLMPVPTGLELLDAALASTEPALVPVLLDHAALREGPPDPLLRDLVPRAAAPKAGGPGDLAGLDAGAKMEVLTDLVRREAAIVLGRGTEDGGLDAGRVYREAGFDSLTAVELRNRLGRALGVPLPVTWVFDHATPRAGARDLLARLDQPRETPSAGRDFTGVYAALVESGQHAAANALATAAAAVRERATTADALAGGVLVTELARGGRLPRLICLPSISTWEPVLNYSAMATHFTGLADVTVIVPPGYTTDAPVAASWSALIDTLAAAVVRVGGDEPYVLVGYSSGGAQAHAVAAEIERSGAPMPRGVVLVDTYPGDHIPVRLQEFFQQQYQQVTRRENYSFEKITASALYIGLHNNEWRLDPAPSVPVLVLTAAAPPQTPEGAAPLEDHEWRHTWPQEHEEVVLDGDHFTIMSRHAGQVAEAIRTRFGGG